LESDIPAGGDVIGEGWSGADFASEAEIADLEDIIIDEEVFGFHIAVEEAVLVHVGESAGDLENHASEIGQQLLDFPLGELLALLLHLGVDLVEVVIEVLEHHVEFLRNQQHFLQFDYVGVVQFPQRLDLSQLDAFIPVCVFLLHLLDCHHFARFGVRRLVDCSESAVAQGFYRLVFLHRLTL
jgi:hypothetical protein